VSKEGTVTGSAIAQGGKSVYGARLGILLLETRFPRIPGDIGNALTWPFPVLYHVVRGASPDRVVRDRAQGLLPAFIEGARVLVALGADGISSSCGFLSLFQREIAQAVGVPVAISSLMQVPLVERLLPAGKRVGILTISAATLSPEHLAAAGVAPDTPVIGTDGGREFSRAILGDEPRLDTAMAERDILEAGDALLARHADIGAIVLECTNMAPYARALARHVQRPVFDIVGFLAWFHAGLQPRDFSRSEE
jgi:Asp/Glu/hydantoin racemase